MAKKLATVRVTQIRSTIGSKPQHRKTIRALGLRKLHQTVEHTATDPILGMIRSVCHLVRVEEVGS